MKKFIRMVIVMGMFFSSKYIPLSWDSNAAEMFLWMVIFLIEFRLIDLYAEL